MRTMPVKTLYLEMLRPRNARLDPPLPDVAIERATRPSVNLYRWLYESVGKDWQWIDRTLLSDAELGAILADPRVEIQLLKVCGSTAGYAELDSRQQGQVELAYFGLLPEYQGQGLGKYFLNCILQVAWQSAPNRVWVHTCQLDHPAALPNYLQAGFVLYETKWVDQVVPS
jgi:GNAT superfamily N-acetyltransferase